MVSHVRYHALARAFHGEKHPGAVVHNFNDFEAMYFRDGQPPARPIGAACAAAAAGASPHHGSDR